MNTNPEHKIQSLQRFNVRKRLFVEILNLSFPFYPFFSFLFDFSVLHLFALLLCSSSVGLSSTFVPTTTSLSLFFCDKAWENLHLTNHLRCLSFSLSIIHTLSLLSPSFYLTPSFLQSRVFSSTKISSDGCCCCCCCDCCCCCS